jgi:hypothetical protein
MMLNRLGTSLITTALLAFAAGCADSGAEPGESTATAAVGSVGDTPGLASSGTPAPGEPTLAEVRAATERFQDVQVALTAGYIPDPSGMCVTAEMEGRPASEGAMGIHYIRPDLLGLAPGPPDPRVTGTSTYTDFRLPAVLIYEPQMDGSLELVAAENLVFIEAWEAAGNTAPPTFHGQSYDRMVDDPDTPFDEAHGFEPHYDRHVWIYRENPLGVFSPMNPAVTCDHHGHGPRGPPASTSSAGTAARKSPYRLGRSPTPHATRAPV